jgi:hypothetical protein
MITPPLLSTNEFFAIQIVHLPTSPGFPQQRSTMNVVEFEGWVTQFADQYQSTWNENMVYGRQDPLSTFQSTRRNISLGFDVVSPSAAAAVTNLTKINKLIQFQYPVYKSATDDSRPTRGQSAVLSAAPLVGLRWTNLISNAADGGYLIGYFKGVTYAPKVEDGGFINAPRILMPSASPDSAATPDLRTVGNETPNVRSIEGPTVTITATRDDIKSRGMNYVPKTVGLSLEFVVLHTHLMGWTMNDEGDPQFGNRFVDGKFPNASTISELDQGKTEANLTDVTDYIRTAVASGILSGGD